LQASVQKGCPKGVSDSSNSEVPYRSFYPFGSSASGGFEEKDRSVAHIHRIRYVLGHSHTVGVTRKRPRPKASVPFCGASVFQCFGCYFLVLCFVYVFVCGDSGAIF
jgi:hypothetical protein